MTDKEKNIKSRIKLLINNIDEFDYKFVTYKAESIKKLLKDTLEYINNKEQKCEELQERTANIIYSLTGGRLSYSTYTLEGCEQAYHDQLEIDVERATKELEEKLQAKEQECEKLKQTLAEIKEIAKEQIPYPNFGEVKTMIEIEYDYAGKIYNLEQRMYKILQKIS